MLFIILSLSLLFTQVFATKDLIETQIPTSSTSRSVQSVGSSRSRSPSPVSLPNHPSNQPWTPHIDDYNYQIFNIDRGNVHLDNQNYQSVDDLTISRELVRPLQPNLSHMLKTDFKDFDVTTSRRQSVHGYLYSLKLILKDRSNKIRFADALIYQPDVGEPQLQSARLTN